MSMTTTMMGAAGALAMATAGVGQMDLTSLPPEPGETQREINGLTHGLADCVEIAEKETGGAAASAELNLTSSPAQVMVTAYSDSARHEVMVSCADGSVLSHEMFQRFPGWELPADAEMQETDSGLMYFVLEEGEGQTPADATAVVEVHYSGYLVDGTKFDSSYDRGQTAEFPLNRVIRGWTEGVGLMSEGAKWKLVIPSDLGYGARGAGGRIPPNAMLVFDVELVSVVSGGMDPESE